MIERQVDRRSAVKLGLSVGAGLIVACKTDGIAGAQLLDGPARDAASPVLSHYVQITEANEVRVFCTFTEMGQGIATGLAMLVGEELDTEPRDIVVRYAGRNDLVQSAEDDSGSTGGSSAIRQAWTSYRKAAAAARAMLVQAAASEWGVQPGECAVANRQITHAASNRTTTFGAVAARAAGLPVPESPALKPTAAFRFVGRPGPKVDVTPKTDGTAVFGIDVQVEGMLYATMVHSPHVGGRVQAVNDTAARAERGVVDVVQTPFGVAVVADSFWRATNGARRLQITWERPHATLSSESMTSEMRRLVDGAGRSADAAGNFDQAFAGAAKKIEVVYEAPYLPHSTLEPQNCVAWVKNDGSVAVWAPTQDPESAQQVAATIAGVDKSRVVVHVTLAGGGFGRRLRVDYVSEAVHIAKAMPGRPIKLIWQRTEEFVRNYYRPASLHKLRLGLDAQGKIVAWQHRIACSSIWSWLSEEANVTPAPQARVESSAVEGAVQLPYPIANRQVEWHQYEPGVPVSWWRSVGHSQNAWVVESAIDELAHKAGKDPLAFRLEMLAAGPRKSALQLAAEKAGWRNGGNLGGGRFQGLAVHQCFGTAVAHVVEIEMVEGAPKLKKVTVAVAAGVVINPKLVEQQMESSIAQGIAGAMLQQITFANGQPRQKNFASCPPLAMADMPDVEVHLVPGGEAPGGIGEPGLPPLAPALCNAVFAATRKRVRKLPLNLDEAETVEG